MRKRPRGHVIRIKKDKKGRESYSEINVSDSFMYLLLAFVCLLVGSGIALYKIMVEIFDFKSGLEMNVYRFIFYDMGLGSIVLFCGVFLFCLSYFRLRKETTYFDNPNKCIRINSTLFCPFISFHVKKRTVYYSDIDDFTLRRSKAFINICKGKRNIDYVVYIRCVNRRDQDVVVSHMGTSSRQIDLVNEFRYIMMLKKDLLRKDNETNVIVVLNGDDNNENLNPNNDSVEKDNKIVKDSEEIIEEKKINDNYKKEIKVEINKK